MHGVSPVPPLCSIGRCVHTADVERGLSRLLLLLLGLGWLSGLGGSRLWVVLSWLVAALRSLLRCLRRLLLLLLLSGRR